MADSYDYIKDFTLGVTNPPANPLPDGYRIYLQDDGRVFRGFMRENYNTVAHSSGDGWKIHLSIHPDDLARAWDKVVTPILFDANVDVAKFVMGDSLIQFADPKYRQAGKMIAIYGSGNRTWDEITKDIEIGLAREGIRPGPATIPKDRMVPGSNYIGYRNDRAFGAMKGYGNHRGLVDGIALQQASDDGVFEKGLEYNPSKQPDPLAQIDFSRDPEVQAAHSGKPAPQGNKAAAEVVRSYLRSYLGDEAIWHVDRVEGGYEVQVTCDFARNELAKAGIDPADLKREPNGFLSVITIPDERLPESVINDAFDENVFAAFREAGIFSEVRSAYRTVNAVGAPAYAIVVPATYSRENLVNIGIAPSSIVRSKGGDGISELVFSIASAAHLAQKPPKMEERAPRMSFRDMVAAARSKKNLDRS